MGYEIWRKKVTAAIIQKKYKALGAKQSEQLNNAKNTVSNAIEPSKERQELLSRAVAKTNETEVEFEDNSKNMGFKGWDVYHDLLPK